MKTYHIKDLLKKDLLIIELPEEKTINTLMDLEITYGYTILGKPDEISDEDAIELVEGSPFNPYFYKQYKSITFHNEKWFKTAKESLLSLLETEIYWDVNPFPYERTESEIIADNLNHCRFITKEEFKFWEAEQKTFDRNRSIILVKQ